MFRYKYHTHYKTLKENSKVSYSVERSSNFQNIRINLTCLIGLVSIPILIYTNPYTYPYLYILYIYVCILYNYNMLYIHKLFYINMYNVFFIQNKNLFSLGI